MLLEIIEIWDSISQLAIFKTWDKLQREYDFSPKSFQFLGSYSLIWAGEGIDNEL